MTERAGGDPAGPTLPAPIGFWGMVTGAWHLYRTNFARLTVMFLAAGVAVFAVTAIPWALHETVGLSLSRPAEVALGLALFVILPTLVGSYAVALSAVIMADGLVGRDTTAREAVLHLRPARHVWVTAAVAAVTGAVLLAFTGLGILLLLLLGPPILMQVIALERVRLGDAWARTRSLLAGRWGISFLHLFSVVAVIALLEASLLLGSATAVESVESGIGRIAPSIAHLAVTSIGFPFFAAAMLVVYFDLRARSEDFGPEELEDERAQDWSSQPGFTGP